MPERAPTVHEGPSPLARRATGGRPTTTGTSAIRTCAGCGGALPYGSRRRYHSRACRRADTALARMSREAGEDPRAYLARMLDAGGGTTGAAVRLGVAEATVRRWVVALRLRPRWTSVVYVPVWGRPRRRSSEADARQARLPLGGDEDDLRH
jgi:hypothetical protein